MLPLPGPLVYRDGFLEMGILKATENVHHNSCSQMRSRSQNQPSSDHRLAPDVRYNVEWSLGLSNANRNFCRHWKSPRTPATLLFLMITHLLLWEGSLAWSGWPYLGQPYTTTPHPSPLSSLEVVRRNWQNLESDVVWG
jgi:hypothetical protein